MKTHLLFFIISFFLFDINYIFASGNDTTGLIPLTELNTGYYKSFQGGLYPNGTNVRPATHNEAGKTLSLNLVPLDVNGIPDTLNGKIIMLSIGMSNTTQEFSTFIPIADTMKEKNSKLVIVDGAQGSQTAAIIQDSTATFWKNIEQRLSTANVSTKQVQTIWLKEADANPKNDFPVHAQTLKNELKKICGILKSKYPKVKLCYISSRIYGGYATSTLNPEPMAYESGFAVKWLIEDQINGDTALTYSGINPKSPWLSWGPYLWADGTNPRNDGLTWVIDDFVTSDRTHPSASGRLKVANMLLDFFKSDETTFSWFLKNTKVNVNDNPIQNSLLIFPNPFSTQTEINYSLPYPDFVKLQIYDIFGNLVSILQEELMETGNHEFQLSLANAKYWNISSGIYFLRLETSGNSVTKIISIIK
ncbi:MAG: T9SS type A sorting domain-containing protein [FCB group bacterium]|jgi:hypothetical protein